MIFYYIISVISLAIEGFSGFGSTAVAMPFLSLVIGTSASVALLTLNSVVTEAIIVAREYKKINRREYLIITLCILPLIPVAVFLYSALARFDMALKIILGAAVALTGGWYVFWYYIKKREPMPLSKPVQYVSLAVGALIQGMFSTGGPFIILYAAQRLKNKGEFRATMTAVWLSVNLVSIALRAWILKLYSWELLLAALKCLPLMLIGIFVGMNMHESMDETNFKKLIYVILLVGGLVSLIYGLITLFN